jgi:hypothetical protein
LLLSRYAILKVANYSIHTIFLNRYNNLYDSLRKDYSKLVVRNLGRVTSNYAIFTVRVVITQRYNFLNFSPKGNNLKKKLAAGTCIKQVGLQYLFNFVIYHANIKFLLFVNYHN